MARSKTAYEWAENNARFLKGVDPGEVGRYMERIAKRKGNGIATAPELVEEVPEDTPLGQHLRATDADAVRLAREERAARVIRVLRVRTESGGQRPAFVHVVRSEDSPNTPGYMNADVAVTMVDTRGFMLKEALGLLRGIQNRYDALTELADVWQAVDLVERAAEKAARKQMADTRKEELIAA